MPYPNKVIILFYGDVLYLLAIFILQSAGLSVALYRDFFQSLRLDLRNILCVGRFKKFFWRGYQSCCLLSARWQVPRWFRISRFDIDHGDIYCDAPP